MKVIVGLGNPGERYRGTRHNVGFLVVDELASRHRASFEGAPAEAVAARARGLAGGSLLVKPLTYVNLSGIAVAELLRYYRIAVDDLLVIVDEVHLPLGRLRARARGSDGGHNGLKSVIERLGTEEFSRLRVGVGRGLEDRDLADHVLSRFLPEERAEVERMIGRAADAAELFATDGIEKVMNVFNVPEGASVEREERDTSTNDTS